jgi:hypothetical protein
MPEEEADRILKSYEEHIKKNLKVEKISLNDYLNVAAICYKTAFGKKIRGLSPLEMYQKFADGRHGGMLDIKDKNSKEEFSNWLKSRIWIGSHPFEIVFSWHNYGIDLFPPSKDIPYFIIRLGNYDYADVFLRMVEALIKNNVPLEASDLDKIIKYVKGETYFRVNEHDEHFFFYSHSREERKEYFKHIIWDELKIPKWRN